MKKNNFYYGWIIAFSCFLVMAIIYAIIFNTGGLFVKYIANDLDISRSSVSFQMTIITLTFAVTSTIVAKVISKIGIKNTMIIGILTSSLGLIGYSYTKSITTFYIFAIMTGLGSGFATLVPINILISSWFEENSGFVTGIVFSATGIGGFLATQLINYIINIKGWRSAYLAVGILCLVIVLPIVSLLIKEKTIKPGNNSSKRKQSEIVDIDNSDDNLKEIIFNKGFIILLIGLFILNFISIGFMSHLPAHITDIGYNANFAATINSIFLVGLMIAKIIMGISLDKLGGKKTFFIGSCAFFITFCLCAFSKSKLLCILFSLTFPIGLSLSTISVPFLTRDIFDKKYFDKILGILTFVGMVGGAIGAPFSGMIYDNFNSYKIAWIVYIFLGGSIYFCIKYAYKILDN